MITTPAPSLVETSLYRFREVFKCDDVIRHTAHAL